MVPNETEELGAIQFQWNMFRSIVYIDIHKDTTRCVCDGGGGGGGHL